MPAVHPADRIRVYRKRQVLWYAPLAPPDAAAVGVGALEWARTFLDAHLPATGACFVHAHDRSAPAAGGRIAAPPPAAEMVRTSHDAGADALRHPDTVNKM